MNEHGPKKADWVLVGAMAVLVVAMIAFTIQMWTTSPTVPDVVLVEDDVAVMRSGTNVTGIADGSGKVACATCGIPDDQVLHICKGNEAEFEWGKLRADLLEAPEMTLLLHRDGHWEIPRDGRTGRGPISAEGICYVWSASNPAPLRGPTPGLLRGAWIQEHRHLSEPTYVCEECAEWIGKHRCDPDHACDPCATRTR